MNKEIISVKKIAIMGVLLALNVILSRFSIHTDSVKIGFVFITLVIAAILYGPVEAAIIGGLGDVLGWVINPIGPFFPGFTITAILTGIVFGLFLKKEVTIIRTIISVAIVQIIIGLGINTYLLTILYGAGFFALLPTRILQAVILIVVQVLCITVINSALIGQLKRIAYAK